MRNHGARTNSALLALVLGLLAPPPRAQAPAGPFKAEAGFLVGADLLELRDGRRVRLAGITLPSPTVRDPQLAQQLTEYARNRCTQKEVWIHPDPAKDPGERADFVATVRERPDLPSINEEILEQGLGLLGLRGPSAEAEALAAAARRAQLQAKGWFALSAPRRFGRGDAVPYLNGAVLGLYDRNLKGGYQRHIDELAAGGFQHVCFLFSALVDHVNASRIERHHRRTISDELLVEAIVAAKKHGMSVMLLPIVLLEDAKPEDWRGTLKPHDEEAFWQSYDRFHGHYLDISERHGVEIFSLGSELGSLEDRTERWRHLIRNARGRYRGMLTYSANWDHVTTARFFPELDLVGMTGYFSLTKKDDPSREELIAGWKKVGGELKATLAGFPKPVFFTELGYASQDGINKDPWNYYIATDRIDLKEQALCLDAFLEVMPELTFLSGAYLFDYFEEGGPTDSSYSPRGKPAWERWQRWAGRR